MAAGDTVLTDGPRPARWSTNPATLARRLAAIAAAHRDAGQPSPTRDPGVTAVLTGIRRARAHPPRRMRPLLLTDIRTLLSRMEFTSWPGGLSAARDSFIVLAGFAGALRRGELAALTVADLTWHPADGLYLGIATSKTDQDAAGATIVLPYGRHPGTCPPCAALRWLRLLALTPTGRPALMRAEPTTAPCDARRGTPATPWSSCMTATTPPLAGNAVTTLGL